MGKGTIGGKIVLEGEKEYRTALKNINTEQKELKSEMKLCSATFKDSQNSTEALRSKYEILSKQVENQTSKVKVYEKAVADSADKEKQAADKVKTLQEAYEKAQKDMDNMSKSSKTTNTELEAQAKTVETLKGKLASAEAGYEKATAKTTTYQTSLNNAKAELTNLQGELSTTSGYLQEAEENTDGCAKSIDEYGKAVKDAGDSSTKFGDKGKDAIDNVAQALQAAGLAKSVKEISQALLDCANSAGEFETSVAKVSTIADSSKISISEMKKELLDTSNDIGKYVTDISEATYNAISAGVDTSKAVSFAGTATKLAVGGFTDATTAVDILTTTLNAYQLSADKTVSISDKLVTTQNLGKTTVAELAAAMGKVIPIAAAYNVDMSNLSSGYALLTASGIKTAESTTYLKSMLNELGDSSSTVGSILQSKTGKTFAELSKEGKSLGDVIDILGKSVDNDKTAFNALWSSSEAGVGALTLLNNGCTKFNDVLSKMNSSAGATEDAFSKMSNTTEYAQEKMSVAFKNLKIAIGEDLNNSLKGVYEGTTDITKAATQFVENNPQVVKAVEAIVIGLGGFIGVVASAQVAVTAFNAVMMVNPYVLATAGLIALTAATVAFVTSCDDQLSAVQMVTQENNKQVESSKALIESHKQAAENVGKTNQSLDEQRDTAKKLVAELNALERQDKLTTEQEIQRKNIVDQLNSIYPELNLAIDEQTGNLNQSTYAILNNIDALTQQAKAQAAQERYAEIAKEEIDSKLQLAELEKQLASAKESTAEAQEAYNEAYKRYTDNPGEATQIQIDELQQLQTELGGAKDSQSALEEQIRATNEDIDSANEKYRTVSEVLGYTQEALDSASDATGQLGEAADDTANRIRSLSESAQTSYRDMYEAVNENVQSSIDLFAEFKAETELSTQDLLNNMQSQVDGITQWADNLELLANRGIDQGLLAHLADLGPTGAGYVSTFVSMTDEELSKANEIFEKSLTLPDSVADKVAYSYATCGSEAAKSFAESFSSDEVTEAVQSMAENVTEALENSFNKDEAKQYGEATIEGIAEGINDESQNLNDTMNNVTEDAADTARNNLDDSTFREIGEGATSGLASGIKDESSSVTSAVKNVADNASSEAEDGFSYSDYHRIGAYASEGLEDGIRDGKSGVVNAMIDTCQSAISAAQNTLDVHSPSRKGYWLGDMWDEGLALGTAENVYKIRDAVSKSMDAFNVSAEMDKGSVRTRNIETTVSDKNIEVNQIINVYSETGNIIETARKFKESQQEAAEQW